MKPTIKNYVITKRAFQIIATIVMVAVINLRFTSLKISLGLLMLLSLLNIFLEWFFRDGVSKEFNHQKAYHFIARKNNTLLKNILSTFLIALCCYGLIYWAEDPFISQVDWISWLLIGILCLSLLFRPQEPFGYNDLIITLTGLTLRNRFYDYKEITKTIFRINGKQLLIYRKDKSIKSFQLRTRDKEAIANVLIDFKVSVLEEKTQPSEQTTQWAKTELP